MPIRNRTIAMLGAVSALSLIAACSPKTVEKAPAATDVSADAAQPAAGKPAADMQKVLDKLASLGGKPIETLSHTDARKQPTPADAVKAVMTDQGMSTAPDPAPRAIWPMGTSRDRKFANLLGSTINDLERVVRQPS
jgi:hypothetical protein